MRILIAPDKFKDSLGARQVASNIAIGLRERIGNAHITELPLADGGEGTAKVLSDALGGEWIECVAHDSLGRAITARFGWIETKKLAVIEMSEAAGLRRLAPNERNAARTDTFGVGEMLLAAAQQGAEQIIVGLGGSATNDGGFGLARALGFRFYDKGDKEISETPTKLIDLDRIAPPKNLLLPQIIIAADVSNPLLGENGATRIFGAQKGAAPAELDALEKALTKLAEVAARDLGNDFRDVPGAGAAGGLGFGLMTFCGAAIEPGFDVVAQKIGLDEAIQSVDVVVTGEGSLDRQTLQGKVPAGVARLARKNGKRVFAIVGRSSGDADNLFDGVFPLANKTTNEAEAITRAGELLRKAGRQLAERL